jgi:hypothetical protein
LTSHTELTAGNYLAATQQTFHAAVFKQYRALLTAVRREPARHGLDGTFTTTTAFVLGRTPEATGTCSQASRSGSSSAAAQDTT